MNNIDTFLSSIADFAETGLTNDPKLRADMNRLIENNQKPEIYRILNSLPGSVLLVRFQKDESSS